MEYLAQIDQCKQKVLVEIENDALFEEEQKERATFFEGFKARMAVTQQLVANEEKTK